MISVYRPILFACFVCGFALAQEATNAPAPSRLDEYMETGMEVSGVRAPYYDEEGHLQAQLFGGHAKILEGGVADVTNIRIDVYDKGEVTMTVFAPHCFTRIIEKGKEKVLSVESDGDVLIEMKQLSISGRGFTFSSDSNRFEILTEPKVLVKEAARNQKGLEL